MKWPFACLPHIQGEWLSLRGHPPLWDQPSAENWSITRAGPWSLSLQPCPSSGCELVLPWAPWDPVSISSFQSDSQLFLSSLLHSSPEPAWALNWCSQRAYIICHPFPGGWGGSSGLHCAMPSDWKPQFHKPLQFPRYLGWRRQWQPTPVLLPENPMDGGAW